MHNIYESDVISPMRDAVERGLYFATESQKRTTLHVNTTESNMIFLQLSYKEVLK